MGRRTAEGYERSAVTAWLAEEIDSASDREYDLVATGLFAASIQGDALYEDFGDPGPLDEVLAWARARADRVIVRTCEVEGEGLHYTAGDVPVDWSPERIRPFPAAGLDLGRRRLPGYEFVDRPDSEAPIQWTVELHTGVLSECGPAFRRRFIDALREVVLECASGPEAIADAADGRECDYLEVRALVHAEASSMEQAEATVRSVLGGVAAAVAEELGGPSPEFDHWFFGTAPTASRYAPSRLD